jgi:hypothetical protein
MIKSAGHRSKPALSGIGNFKGSVAQFVNFMVLQGCLDIGNGFSRGEAVAMIGSSEPIIVTEEECGQKSSCQQNHTDLLDLLYLVSIIPNRSDT